MKIILWDAFEKDELYEIVNSLCSLLCRIKSSSVALKDHFSSHPRFEDDVTIAKREDLNFIIFSPWCLLHLWSQSQDERLDGELNEIMMNIYVIVEYLSKHRRIRLLSFFLESLRHPNSPYSGHYFHGMYQYKMIAAHRSGGSGFFGT